MPEIYPKFTQNIVVLIINSRVIYLKQIQNLPEIYSALSN